MNYCAVSEQQTGDEFTHKHTHMATGINGQQRKRRE